MTAILARAGDNRRELMKTQMKSIASALAVALLAGCASGSGSGSGVTVTDGRGNTTELSEEEGLACILLIFLCPLIVAESAGAAQPTSQAVLQPAAHFMTWTDLKRDTRTRAPGLGLNHSYAADADGVIRSVVDPWPASTIHFAFDASDKAVYLEDGSATGYATHTGTLAALGQPGIDRVAGRADGPFAGATNAALVANPYALGWNYQSFGAWNGHGATGNGAILANSFGLPTPASAVPASGTATFTGKSAGYYISPSGHGAISAAELTVSANFSARSLGFATSGTTIAHDIKAPAAAPHLNLSGSFTYSAGANAFAGTVTNAGGTMSGRSDGRFYGPAAQELGGVFSLRSSTSVETFTGAYGAKR